MMLRCEGLSVKFPVSEEFLNQLKLCEREKVEEAHEYLSNSAEMEEGDDFTLMVATYGNRMYEIATTCGAYNLYLFTSVISENGDTETVGAENISYKLDELRSYNELLDYIRSIIGV